MSGGQHCCAMMAGNVEETCSDHPDRFDCPDMLIHWSRKSGRYGIMIHDGGESTIEIAYCPWCGTQLASQP